MKNNKAPLNDSLLCCPPFPQIFPLINPIKTIQYLGPKVILKPHKTNQQRTCHANRLEVWEGGSGKLILTSSEFSKKKCTWNSRCSTRLWAMLDKRVATWRSSGRVCCIAICRTRVWISLWQMYRRVISMRRKFTHTCSRSTQPSHHFMGRQNSNGAEASSFAHAIVKNKKAKTARKKEYRPVERSAESIPDQRRATKELVVDYQTGCKKNTN